MKKVEIYRLPDGSTVGIELDFNENTHSNAARPVSQSANNVGTDSSFTKIVDRIPTLTNTIFSALKEINEPKEVELEMGIKISAKAGIVIASTDSEAHFKLKIKWVNE